MTRPLRIQFEGALYHVMSRGNERRPIVRDDADRRQRISCLRRVAEHQGWHVHAFCLMTNHDHLFIDTPHANLSAGMQSLNGVYSAYFNRRHRRHGHLFQGRFKAQIIEEQGHFVEISRYIHLNPVRAGMVERAEQYPWSSYGGYHSTRSALHWITYQRVLCEFGSNSQQARAEYRKFVRAGVRSPPASPFANAVEGLIVGSEGFVERVRQAVGERRDYAEMPALRRLRKRPSLDVIVNAVAQAFGVQPQLMCRSRSRSNDLSRAAAAWLARRRFGYSASATARAIGYARASSVGSGVNRIEALAPTTAPRKALRDIERELANG